MIVRLFLIALLGVHLQSFGSNTLDKQQKLYGLGLVWKEASYNFAYFDQVPDLDWDATYQSYIPKVLATQSDHEYYQVMSQFVALLNDGMSYVKMSDSLRVKYSGMPAVKLAEAQNNAVVVGVDIQIQNRLPLGSIITHVDGIETAAYLQDKVFPFISSSTEQVRWHEGIRGNQSLGYGLLMGEVGTDVVIDFISPEQEVGRITVSRVYDLSQTQWHLASGVNDGKGVVTHKVLEDGIQYVAINNFQSEKVIEQFEALLPQLQLAKALVIDLRINRGGNTYVAEKILQYLTFHNLSGTRSKMRIHNATYKAWGKYASQFSWAKKYQPYFEGDAWQQNDADILLANEIAMSKKVVVPTAVLTSRETSAAAESFLVYVSDAKHISIVGEPTFGSSGQPLEIDLPGGGSATICTKRETFADGRDFIGVGVQPDVFVARDVGFYLSENDKTLSSATEVLRLNMKEGLADNQLVVNSGYKMSIGSIQ
jgi:C-terminal processing protease CtpA/Prc